MTASSINIAIAEVLGFVQHSGNARWVHPKTGDLVKFTDLPNFHGNLNACAEMEATLGVLTMVCESRLQDILNRDFRAGINSNNYIFRATAPQRCEAFLKTRGKWIKEKA